MTDPNTTTPTQTYARQAILTRYFGPTNHKGSRVKAHCEAGSITLSWDHALNSFGNHQTAARALLAKLGWEVDDFVGGGLPRSARDAYAFVNAKAAS